MDDASKYNTKLYWELLKDIFHSKTSNELPPIKYTDCNGKDSDIDKIDILNKYFCSFFNISITSKSLPKLFLQCDGTLNDIVIEEYKLPDIMSVLPVNEAIGP